MVVVAQLVRALDCGSRGRRFEPVLPPTHERLVALSDEFFYFSDTCGKMPDARCKIPDTRRQTLDARRQIVVINLTTRIDPGA